MQNFHVPDSLISSLRSAKKVMIITGAGASKESGLGTFRDNDGEWYRMNPMDMASPNGFSRNPPLVWKWYRHRRHEALNALPNAGHTSLATMEKLFDTFEIFTQNVDGLHQRAGSKNVYELHGSLHSYHCFDCSHPFEKEEPYNDESPEQCTHCRGLIRPSVVWFTESLPVDVLSKAEIAAKECDVFMSIGTSSEVFPANTFGTMASHYGAVTIEINPHPTIQSDIFTYRLPYASGEILPIIVKQLHKK
jgi:NAD-dependent deacetylase